MSTFKELNYQNLSLDTDEILLHNNVSQEDVRTTKDAFLSEVKTSIADLNSDIQEVNTKISSTGNISEVIAGNTQLKVVNIDNIPVTNELQGNQSNILPPANSVDAGTMLRILVTDQNKGITTTHLVSGTDTTSDSGGNSDGFIFQWLEGGEITLISNGLNNWRY